MRILSKACPAIPLLSAAVAWSATLGNFAAEQMIVPLERAHAHNDYEHRRPLMDALDRGFCSVEADIYLVNGKLLVAHDRSEISADRTLQALYLDPLRQRVRAHGGHVFPKGPLFTLLIDVKTEADATYSTLRDVLNEYREMLTSFSGESIHTNAVLVILSGNRPRELLKKEALRYAAYDGRLADLEGSEPRSFIPLVSDNWATAFRWRGTGTFSMREKERLNEIVEKAHRQGRRVRFWGTPDLPAVWKELFAAGVDLINTDDLFGLQKFLLSDAGRVER